MRKRWLVPMLIESKKLKRVSQKVIIITHAQQELMNQPSLNFNAYLFETAWDFVGMYPPGPETLLISRSNIQMVRMMGYTDFPRENRILCWKRKSDCTRIIVFIDVEQALRSQCIQEPLENPQEGWCWIAKLEKPFNLECAQKLLMTMCNKQNMPLFELRDNLGQIIPCHQILSYLDDVQAQRRPSEGDVVPEASIRTVDVNELL
ncbi:hypothetical protein PFICI_02516 [Pestalotiopsis fici W106-1]|uniref:Uncharacterized protein n=1 Tax=Pestalotiopsis fici (strain W106-1 / CGMCC3.15140) TaxID=1229662 RepID=W3XGY6_PESFW|nr:uncharacterized protein PFICI_02516 [Pestalotiopsis fici W106-1]ETS84491.1 hypothetical protein PFICI_02516 [Pestalotiopsis fici W106-1]